MVDDELLIKSPFIHLDMDGCSADWEFAILKHPVIKRLGIQDIQGLNMYPDREKWIAEVYLETPDFFLNLPYIDEFDHILDVVSASGVDFGFLSCVGTTHHCFDTAASHKQDWLERHVRERLGLAESDDSVLLNAVRHHEDKVRHSHSRAVLIDDFHRNIDQWRKAGGEAVHLELKKHGGRHYADELSRLIDKIKH